MRLGPTVPWLLCLASILSPTIARQAPTSYCKCICFQNSTIIPLNSPPEKRPPQDSNNNPRAITYDLPIHDDQIPAYQLDPRNDKDKDKNQNKHHKTLTCSDCNRAFCLDYNLPICKGAKEEDVFTSCFQRDSVKDETVVFLFILLTGSLLSWAVLKPFIDGFRDAGSVTKYAPVTLGAGGSGSGARGARGFSSRSEGSYGNNRTVTRSRGDSVGSIARQGGLNS